MKAMALVAALALGGCAADATNPAATLPVDVVAATAPVPATDPDAAPLPAPVPALDAGLDADPDATPADAFRPHTSEFTVMSDGQVSLFSVAHDAYLYTVTKTWPAPGVTVPVFVVYEPLGPACEYIQPAQESDGTLTLDGIRDGLMWGRVDGQHPFQFAAMVYVNQAPAVACH